MNKTTVPAKIEELDRVLDFIQAELNENDCAMKAQLQIMIAVEEIFVNIVHYAYIHKNGEVEIESDFIRESRSVRFSFADRGVPYNPLKKKDPDITRSAEDREIGGLGIYMVKKSMDKVLYENKDNKNILTIIKKLD